MDIYVAIKVDNGEVRACTSKTQVADIVGCHRNTVINSLTRGNGVCVIGEYRVVVVSLERIRR